MFARTPLPTIGPSNKEQCGSGDPRTVPSS